MSQARPDKPQASIYAAQANTYDRLIEREDYQGNLLNALRAVGDFSGSDVLDLGCGSGRLVRLLAPHCNRVTGLDLSVAMLHAAQRTLPANAVLAAADHRALPLLAASADLVVSGWSFCYLMVWHPATWQDELHAALLETQRVLRPGGLLALFETMGTGFSTPNPPSHLLPYYDWLRSQGFAHTWLRTDYRFASLDEAVELSGFFFGTALAEQVRHQASTILPECTGLWWRYNA